VTRFVDVPDRREIVGGKGSVFYRTHSYHTKVPPEGIVPLLEHYTHPRDRVLDPFCGSGMTGIACLLTGRQGVLSDLSPAAVHIASGHTAPAHPADVKPVAQRLLAGLADLEEDLYGSSCTRCGGPARIEYTVWSDELACPHCGCHTTFWDAARTEAGTVASRPTCPGCARSFRKRDAALVGTTPVLVSVACRGCRRRAQRPLTDEEHSRAVYPHRREVTDWFPTAPLETWREMWRGQHRDLGIATAADFFTDRNLRALAAVWSRVNAAAGGERALLRFAVTAMVNRASRRYQWNPKRPTNVLSGTLYIASLTYEFNVFSLLRRKLAAVGALAAALHGAPGSVTLRQASATRLDHVEDRSIDYVFTDPPFGSNIYYSDASFLWEAWLDDFTPTAEEAVVNTSLRADRGGKTLQDYEKLMAASFTEVARVMKPGAWASVVFHNSDDTVWSALEQALESAGLQLEAAVAFDKTQPSFKGIKQLTSRERVPSFDVVLHLRTHRRSPNRPREPGRAGAACAAADVDRAIVAAVAEHLGTAPTSRRSTPFLHSYVMRLLLERSWPVSGYSYRKVEAMLGEHFVPDGRGWRVSGDGPAVARDPADMDGRSRGET
jgi:16S rRNA G966 N2-methylase RsmD